MDATNQHSPAQPLEPGRPNGSGRVVGHAASTKGAGHCGKLGGVIFDLDGTLVDTLDDITDSINHVFARDGLAPVDRERIRALIGEGLTTLLRRASQIEDEQRLSALVAAYRSVYRKRMLDCTRLFPGVAATLDELTRRGSTLAVLSNKPDEFTVPICQALLARWPFAGWRGSRSEADRKPDPATARQLAAIMEQPVEAICFVGDSPVDVATARNAGMMSIAVTWGYRDRDQLVAAEPDGVADSPADLMEILRRMMNPDRREGTQGNTETLIG